MPHKPNPYLIHSDIREVILVSWYLGILGGIILFLIWRTLTWIPCFRGQILGPNNTVWFGQLFSFNNKRLICLWWSLSVNHCLFFPLSKQCADCFGKDPFKLFSSPTFHLNFPVVLFKSFGSWLCLESLNSRKYFSQHRVACVGVRKMAHVAMPIMKRDTSARRPRWTEMYRVSLLRDLGI